MQRRLTAFARSRSQTSFSGLPPTAADLGSLGARFGRLDKAIRANMGMVAAPPQRRQLTDPKTSLGTLSPWDAAKLITAAADVTLILDSKGLIRDAAFS